MTIGEACYSTMLPDGSDHQEHDHGAEDQPPDARQAPPTMTSMILPDGRHHQENDDCAEDHPSDARQPSPDGGEQDRQNGQNQQRLEEHGLD